MKKGAGILKVRFGILLALLVCQPEKTWGTQNNPLVSFSLFFTLSVRPHTKCRGSQEPSSKCYFHKLNEEEMISVLTNNCAPLFQQQPVVDDVVDDGWCSRMVLDSMKSCG